MLPRPIGPVGKAFNSAAKHARAGRWRRAADAYLKCYLLPACAAWEGSTLALDGFTSIVQDGRLSAAQTVPYIKALKRIAIDEHACTQSALHCRLASRLLLRPHTAPGNRPLDSGGRLHSLAFITRTAGSGHADRAPMTRNRRLQLRRRRDSNSPSEQELRGAHL